MSANKVPWPAWPTRRKISKFPVYWSMGTLGSSFARVFLKTTQTTIGLSDPWAFFTIWHTRTHTHTQRLCRFGMIIKSFFLFLIFKKIGKGNKTIKFGRERNFRPLSMANRNRFGDDHAVTHHLDDIVNGFTRRILHFIKLDYDFYEIFLKHHLLQFYMFNISQHCTAKTVRFINRKYYILF